jgi:hypothetical protein
MIATWADAGKWVTAITRSTRSAFDASSGAMVDGGSVSAPFSVLRYMACPFQPSVWRVGQNIGIAAIEIREGTRPAAIASA